MKYTFTFLLALAMQVALTAQISQYIIKGSDSNVIYQSFYSEEGGELESILISTDQTGFVTIRLFENEKQKTADNPIWEVINVPKNKSGELLVHLDQGYGITNSLLAGKKYAFSIVGAGNIHHSFLDDTYDGGNYRFEDGIERKGDLFFELNLRKNDFETTTEEEVHTQNKVSHDISVYPNPTSGEVIFKGIVESTIVNVYDSEGRLHAQKNLPIGEKLYLSQLVDGLYFLQFKVGEEVYVKKLVKTSH